MFPQHGAFALLMAQGPLHGVSAFDFLCLLFTRWNT